MAEFIDAGKSLANIRKQYQEQGIFYSSLDLARQLQSYLPADTAEVYDPTCGAGALLSVWPDSVKKFGQELDPSAAQFAREHLANAEIADGDTLKAPAFWGKKFKAIVANPPFSIKWDPQSDERFAPAQALAPKSKADYAFIMHCLYYLSDDGKCAVLDAPGILFRGGAEGKIRRWLVDNNYIERIAGFGPEHFQDTKISTCALILSKHKNTTDILLEDTVGGLGRRVTLEEVQRNDYDLSLQRYCKACEPYDPPPDPREAFEEFQKFYVSMLQGVIELYVTLATDVNPLYGKLENFFKEIRDAVDEGERKISGRGKPV